MPHQGEIVQSIEKKPLKFLESALPFLQIFAKNFFENHGLFLFTTGND